MLGSCVAGSLMSSEGVLRWRRSAARASSVRRAAVVDCAGVVRDSGLTSSFTRCRLSSVASC